MQSYWEMSASTPDDGIDEVEMIERTRALVCESIRLRLRADAPVGFYLSGGIDSSSILGVSSHISQRPQNAFSLCFSHESYNEERYAREMADYCGAKLHLIEVCPADVAEHFSDVVYHTEALFWNAQGVAKHLMSRAVRDRGFKVVLTGEGADELFAGYPSFIQDMLADDDCDQKQPKKKTAALLKKNETTKGTLIAHGCTLDDLDVVRDMIGFVPAWMSAFSSSASRIIPFLSEEFKSTFSSRNVYRQMFELLPQLPGKDRLSKSLSLWSKFLLPFHVLSYEGDRTEMAHSIEGRPPFLDHKLAEFAWGLQSSMKIRNMTNKYVLREAMKPYLPESIFKREKNAFMAPPTSLGPETRLYEFLQDTLRSVSFAAVPFFDQGRVLKLLDKLAEMSLSEKIAVDPVLNMMLSATFLQRRFGMSWV